MNSPERSRTAVFGSRAQKDYHYPTGLYNIIFGTIQYNIVQSSYINFTLTCTLNLDRKNISVYKKNLNYEKSKDNNFKDNIPAGTG